MKIEFNADGSLKLPEKMVKSKDESEKKERIKEFTNDYWKDINFDVKRFFINKKYIGCFKSKRNWYYAYEFEKYFLVSTGLKEISRFNIVLDEEVEEIKKVISEYFSKSFFTMADLMDKVKNTLINSKRVVFYSNNQLEDLHFNDFYNILLQICYLLTAKKELVLEKQGKNIIFALQDGFNESEKRPDIFRDIEYLKSTEKSLIFKNNKFYFDIRCSNFRGSIYSYLVDELEYMENIIKNSAEKNLDVEKIMRKMEYEQRFHDIYQMIIDKNIRNDREIFDFFVSRVKSALRIIGTITDLVEIEKEGRGNIFLKKN